MVSHYKQATLLACVKTIISYYFPKRIVEII